MEKGAMAQNERCKVLFFVISAERIRALKIAPVSRVLVT
jgi:hypothetical protein